MSPENNEHQDESPKAPGSAVESIEIDESAYIQAEQKVSHKLAPFFKTASMGKYPGSTRVFVKLTLPDREQYDKVCTLLDLANISYWDDDKNESITIDNHFDIEALVEQEILDISDMDDEEYRLIALSSEKLAEEFEERTSPSLTSSTDSMSMKSIPALFKKTKNEVSPFDDMSEGEEGVRYDGDTSYLYKHFLKKYRRTPGKLFQKTKEGLSEMSAEAQKEILNRAQAGDEKARNDFLIMNMGLVYFTVFNMSRLFPTLNQAEMLQEALIQMNKCIDTHDSGRGTFSTYAVASMKYVIVRYARDIPQMIKVSSDNYTDIGKVTKLDKVSSGRFGRNATPYEIARELNISIDNAKDLINIKETVTNAEYEDITDEDLENEEAFVEEERLLKDVMNVEMKAAVDALLDTLTPKRALIMRLRFGIDVPDDLTLDQVANKVGVTRERIRQIEKKTLQQLRHPSVVDKYRGFVDYEYDLGSLETRPYQPQMYKYRRGSSSLEVVNTRPLILPIEEIKRFSKEEAWSFIRESTFVLPSILSKKGTIENELRNSNQEEGTNLVRTKIVYTGLFKDEMLIQRNRIAAYERLIEILEEELHGKPNTDKQLEVVKLMRMIEEIKRNIEKSEKSKSSLF